MHRSIEHFDDDEAAWIHSFHSFLQNVSTLSPQKRNFIPQLHISYRKVQ